MKKRVVREIENKTIDFYTVRVPIVEKLLAFCNSLKVSGKPID